MKHCGLRGNGRGANAALQWKAQTGGQERATPDRLGRRVVSEVSRIRSLDLLRVGPAVAWISKQMRVRFAGQTETCGVLCVRCPLATCRIRASKKSRSRYPGGAGSARLSGGVVRVLCFFLTGEMATTSRGEEGEGVENQ